MWYMSLTDKYVSWATPRTQLAEPFASWWLRQRLISWPSSPTLVVLICAFENVKIFVCARICCVNLEQIPPCPPRWRCTRTMSAFPLQERRVIHSICCPNKAGRSDAMIGGLLNAWMVVGCFLSIRVLVCVHVWMEKLPCVNNIVQAIIFVAPKCLHCCAHTGKCS